MDPKPSNAPITKAQADLSRPVKNTAELRQLFNRPDVINQVKLTLPKHMSPERITKILLSLCLKTPKLMECSQMSLIQSLMQLSEIGLEPGSAFGHVYLLPFENRQQKRTDVTIIIGYKGLLELARRSGFVEQIESHVVFDDEVFELEYGLSTTRKFRHVPNIKDPRDENRAIAVYCIARLKNGGEHVEVMPMSDVRKIRDNSQGYKRNPSTSPWKDHFLQMARKTAIRRACNYLPLSAEMAQAFELEDANTVDGTVMKPSLPSGASDSAGDDIAGAMANAAQDDARDAAPPHDPVTGEVREPGQDDDAGATPTNEQLEPEKGTVDHLLWRIWRASAEQLAELTKEAAALPKDEPRRLAVSKAIAERRKAVQS